ncbi:MAG: hypothetical protein AAFQ95_22545 [Cyanobacteria bacterium J06621_3]
MPRPKKKSAVLPDAAKRLSGMRSIDPKLDFGSGFSNAAFAKLIDQVTEDLDAYNTLLSKLDEAYNTFEASERQLAKFSSKMLSHVAIRYDKDSSEYEMAGGKVRDRRKAPRKTIADRKTTATPKATVAAV